MPIHVHFRHDFLSDLITGAWKMRLESVMATNMTGISLKWRLQNLTRRNPKGIPNPLLRVVLIAGGELLIVIIVNVNEAGVQVVEVGVVMMMMVMIEGRTQVVL